MTKLKARFVEIQVLFYSEYAEGIELPNFSSVICDGEQCPNHFISGVGIITKSSKEAEAYYKGVPVVFCGFTDNLIKQYVSTNINNVSKITGQILPQHSCCGYLAYIQSGINAISPLLGKTVIIDAPLPIGELIYSMCEICGGKTFYLDDFNTYENNGFLADAAIIWKDSIKNCANCCKATAEIVGMNKINEVNLLNRQKYINMRDTGELALDKQFAKDGIKFPKHYIMLSTSAMLEYSAMLISKKKIKDTTISFLVDSIVSLPNSVSLQVNLLTSNCENIAKCELVDVLSEIYKKSVSPGLLKISFFITEKKECFEIAKAFSMAVVKQSVIIDQHFVDANYECYMLTCKDGSSIVISIYKSEICMEKIELHIGGISAICQDGVVNIYYKTTTNEIKCNTSLMKILE